MADSDPENRLRVIIADDEPFARQRLVSLLEREHDVDLVGTAASGNETVDLIRGLQAAGTPADIVFLDIQMPGGTGMDVVRTIGPEAMPVVVFVTAYDRHAVEAFQVAALDYLLKPFENDRFRQALERARSRVRLNEVNQIQEQLLALLEKRRVVNTDAAASEPPSRLKYLERIAVESRGQIRVVPVDRIDYFTAEEPYVRLFTGEESYLIRDTLQAIEERLDPARFFRIHRSTIVQMDRVEALLTAPGGDYTLRIRGGTRLKLARSRREDLARRFGFT